jgi:hypothetical protein
MAVVISYQPVNPMYLPEQDKQNDRAVVLLIEKLRRTAESCLHLERP